MSKAGIPETISIVLSPDDNYAPHAGVLIASILKNADVGERIDFYILDDGLSPSTKEKLEQVRRTCASTGVKAEIKYLTIDRDTFKSFPTKEHISIATYYRLMIGDLLPGLKRCLYLDCDMVALSSLKPLWEMNLEGHVVGMVRDVTHLKLDAYWGLKGPKEAYCNAGMLLMDMEKWAKMDMLARTFEFFDRYKEKIIYNDQDAINIILRGKIKMLPFKWNFQESYNTAKKAKKNVEFGASKKEKPCIIHYISRHKPWLPRAKRFDKTRHYFDYLALTPWRGQVRDYWKKRVLWHYGLDNIFEVYRDRSFTSVKVFRMRVYKKNKGK